MREVSRREVVRLGLEREGKPFSSIWRFWSNKDDVYVAARNVAGRYKLSLHASGQWITAFTKESGLVNEKDQRRITEGARPQPIGSGWTEAPFISIPRIDEKHDLPAPGELDAKASWLPAPRTGHVVLLGLLYSEHGEIRPAEASGQDIHDVGHLDLESGERVWITRSEKQLAQDAIEELRAQREPLIVQVTPGADLDDVGGSLILLHAPAGAEVAFTEIVLGRHLFREAPPS
jgi:hypothetical protein